jgi:hypothetical protein
LSENRFPLFRIMRVTVPDYIARSKRISRRNAPLDGKTRAASATGGSPASSLSSTASAHEHGTFRGDANFQRAVQITILRGCFRNRAQIEDAYERGARLN